MTTYFIVRSTNVIICKSTNDSSSEIRHLYSFQQQHTLYTWVILRDPPSVFLPTTTHIVYMGHTPRSAICIPSNNNTHCIHGSYYDVSNSYIISNRKLSNDIYETTENLLDQLDCSEEGLVKSITYIST